MNITEHSTTEELKCPCCGRCDMDQYFIASLETFRCMWGQPMIINSGFRCMKHNQACGGAPRSQHPLGKAVDVKISADQRYAFIKLAIELGFKGIGIAKDFVHIDTRSDPAQIWKY